jgi:hypothetical protein
MTGSNPALSASLEEEEISVASASQLKRYRVAKSLMVSG